ncbi:hypothetical protein ACFQ0E_10600 [Lysobacter brunescens]|uniref:Uncharacterized protein n=1 Tax=Lysobacter brunescens TaxID=262323 RepID=A0ABW2YD01_9GAMM
MIDEVAEDVPALDLTSEINSQALTNMAMIPLCAPFADEENRDSFRDVLQAAFHYYAGLLDLSEHPHGFLFYAWVDAQASQLRISAINGSFSSPPFGCDCDFSASIDDIAADCTIRDHSLFGPRNRLAVWTQRLPNT